MVKAGGRLVADARGGAGDQEVRHSFGRGKGFGRRPPAAKLQRRRGCHGAENRLDRLCRLEEAGDGIGRPGVSLDEDSRVGLRRHADLEGPDDEAPVLGLSQGPTVVQNDAEPDALPRKQGLRELLEARSRADEPTEHPPFRARRRLAVQLERPLHPVARRWEERRVIDQAGEQRTTHVAAILDRGAQKWLVTPAGSCSAVAAVVGSSYQL